MAEPHHALIALLLLGAGCAVQEVRQLTPMVDMTGAPSLSAGWRVGPSGLMLGGAVEVTVAPLSIAPVGQFGLYIPILSEDQRTLTAIEIGGKVGPIFQLERGIGLRHGAYLAAHRGAQIEHEVDDAYSCERWQIMPGGDDEYECWSERRVFETLGVHLEGAGRSFFDGEGEDRVELRLGVPITFTDREESFDRILD